MAICSPHTLEGRVDVVVGVVPYVPTSELPLLQRDTFAFESPLSYDGGSDGTEILRRVLTDSPCFLRRGGALLLELGGEQADALGEDLARLGYIDVTVLVDEDGDVRGIEATLGEQRQPRRLPDSSLATDDDGHVAASPHDRDATDKWEAMR